MLKRINAVLPELIGGILIFGVLVQLTGVWFVENKAAYSSGLWIGIAAAVGMAIHMAVVLNDAAELAAEEASRRKVIIQSMLRYAVIVIVCFLVAFLRLGNLITFFLGVMGLKAGAYMQPLTHKFIAKLTGSGDMSSDSQNEKA